MARIYHFCLVAAMALMPALAQPGQPDQAFERIPFQDWLKGVGESRIRWSMGVFPAHLSEHQRLETSVWADIKGGELSKRSRRGQMVVFLEIRDRDNRVYRTHQPLMLGNQRNTDLALVKFTQHAFFMPGDYSVAAAVYDSVSKEHSLKRTRFRVAELAHDPLPAAWRGLPSVEYSSGFMGASSRLFLPVETEKPVHIEVVVNESFYPTTMNRLTPLLKAISEMEIRNGSMHVALLDLERRKVSFAQDVAGNLDWRRWRTALRENDPNRIDAHALELHNQDAQFFVSEIRKRLERDESGEAKRVLIVLSAPRTFPKGQDLRPIQAAPQPGTRVFYIRSYPSTFLGIPDLMPHLPGRGHHTDAPEAEPDPPVAAPPIPEARRRVERIDGSSDSLAPLVRPLEPKMFNVTTAEQFRNALAAIMNEISQQK
jgi:hypothetical protein